MADYVQPTLLDMPEIVMNHIFSYLDVKSIFKMQKVCLQLHNFVDEQKPDIHLTSMELKATTYGFTCRISSELFGNFRIKYLKTAMACPRMRKNGILLEHDYPMPNAVVMDVCIGSKPRHADSAEYRFLWDWKDYSIGCCCRLR
ncbi:hypothetical protein L5515_009431 [Caenorhabditis briggsae]|uniref:F-box domain-containing protein n=1 Tax=Caenorhabditis briggsae TaxID=6238 RepID=A0AAE9FAB8_CAEBR|nr:hypothetical protein L5515_009431 [Caenorhabditis briggsae]